MCGAATRVVSADSPAVAPARVAVIGTGSIGSRHLRLLRQLPNVTAVAISMRPERAAELAVAGYVTSASVAASGAKLVIVATDTVRHASDVRAAFEAGADVLVEKPLTTFRASGLEVLDLARRCGRRLAVGCDLRFSESLGVFREWLPRLGRLHGVDVRCHSYLPDWRPERPYRDSYSARAEEGGVLRDLIHEIDYAGWLFGWPRALMARVRNTGRLQIGADETADVLWETNSGALVTLSLDYLSRPTRRGIRARGEHGELVWDAIERKVTLHLPESPALEFVSSQTTDDVFAAELQATLAALGGKTDPRQASGEDGVRALAVCEAMWRSTARRREEPVDLI